MKRGFYLAHQVLVVVLEHAQALTLQLGVVEINVRPREALLVVGAWVDDGEVGSSGGSSIGGSGTGGSSTGDSSVGVTHPINKRRVQSDRRLSINPGRREFIYHGFQLCLYRRTLAVERKELATRVGFVHGCHCL